MAKKKQSATNSSPKIKEELSFWDALRTEDLPALRGFLASQSLDAFGNEEETNHSPLHWCFAFDKLDPVNLILKAGGKPKSESGHDGWTLVHCAAHAGSLRAMKLALKLTPSSYVNKVDHFGQPPLLRAISSGNVQLVSLLLKKGAKTKWKHWGSGALYHAASHHQLKIIDLLLKYGATGLDEALNATLKNDDLSEAKFLIKRGANFQKRDKESGQTFLHKSVEYFSPMILKMLLEKGANVNVKDNDGRTALDHAKLYYQNMGGESWNEIIQTLVKHGAK